MEDGPQQRTEVAAPSHPWEGLRGKKEHRRPKAWIGYPPERPRGSLDTERAAAAADAARWDAAVAPAAACAGATREPETVREQGGIAEGEM